MQKLNKKKEIIISGNFDSKSFNEKAFKYSVEHARIPNLKTNELKNQKH